MPGISVEGQQRELEKETSSGHEAALAIRSSLIDYVGGVEAAVEEA